MNTSGFTIRAAVKEDASALAELIVIAGEGIPLDVWHMINSEQDPMTTGIERASRETGGFSYRNAIVAEVEGEVAGMCLAYHLQAPTDEDRRELCSLPSTVQAFVRLEWLVPETWYFNALAVFPQYRRSGIANALMQASERQAVDQGMAEASIIVFAGNRPALELYTTQRGYTLKETEPPLEDARYRDNGDVVLLTKRLG